MSTATDISAKISSSSLAKFDSITFPALDAFYLTNPMHFINDFTQALVISMSYLNSNNKSPSLTAQS